MAQQDDCSKLFSKRKDLGIAATVVMAVQLLSGYQHSQSVATEVGKLKDEFHQSLIENEKYFVNKSDLEKLAVKIDQIDERVKHINDEMISMKAILKEEIALEAGNEEIVGCVYHEQVGSIYGI